MTPEERARWRALGLDERMRRRPRAAAWGQLLALLFVFVVPLTLCGGCTGLVLLYAAHALLARHPHPP